MKPLFLLKGIKGPCQVPQGGYMTLDVHIPRAVAHWSSARESRSLKERQEGLRQAATAGRMDQATVQ